MIIEDYSISEEKIQAESRKLVRNHVFANLSMLVSHFSRNPHLLDVSECSYDDDILPICMKYDWLEPARDNGFDGNTQEDAQIYCEQNNLEPYTIDALEHWLISDWLAYQLESESEMVGSIFALNTWGRQTSGQAVYMDYIIQKLTKKYLMRY